MESWGIASRLIHCLQGPGPGPRSGMESSGIVSRLIHCQQGPRPGTRSGMESFVTLYHLIHWRQGPRPGNEIGNGVICDAIPFDSLAAGTGTEEPMPQSPTIPIPNPIPNPIPIPIPPSGASHLRRFLTSFFLRAGPIAPVPLPLLLTNFLQWTVSLSLPGSSRW